MTRHLRRALPTGGWVAVVLAVPLCAGCGKGTAELSGTVKFGGKPLPGGIVTFTPAEGNPVMARIGEDGSYKATVPAGELKVAVDNRGLSQAPGGPTGPGGGMRPGGRPSGPTVPPKDAVQGGMPVGGGLAPKGPTPPGKYVKIPEKFYSASTSGLTVTVDGSKTWDIELK